MPKLQDELDAFPGFGGGAADWKQLHWFLCRMFIPFYLLT
jgi:hypothetical protein